MIKFAEEKLVETIERPEVNAFAWAKPAFFHGNGLAQELPHAIHFYDRIYCGAAVSEDSTINRLVKLLAIGGKLIVPFKNSLMAYTRTAENSCSSQVLMACQFADLLPPTEEDRHDCLAPLIRPLSLADLCRNVIRASLRENVLKECPVFMRCVAEDSNPMGSDDSASHQDTDAEMVEGQNQEEINIVRHPIRVELFRNLGAARIHLETFERPMREPRNRDARMRDVVTVQLQDGERDHARRGGEGGRDAELGANMFVFADEGAPSDEEELDDEDRMGLQWLNAILGFERDPRGQRNRGDEGRERSASSSGDSSDTSVAEEAVEEAGNNPAETLQQTDSTQDVQDRDDGDEPEEQEPEGDEDEDEAGNDERNWESFPRDVMDLREFLVSTRNRNSELSLMPLSICCPFIVSAISSGAAARERNTRNGTEGGGGSKKLAEEERDRQHASLKNFGEAFNEALWKLPLPKHLIKYLALQYAAPAFANKSSRWA
ncbi:unnamed protein product [Heligmosomoides polygyrus]|uniref:Uncharacterized protein n=1 Tax=Heligmosomoides polygyrus TaxID=6339 RepID=A0A3P8CSC6_HELPZ|nr:unnamed protein product [Heligmosomoides polygyrus]